MKILIVGSKSVHVSSFIENLFLKGQSISLLSEEICVFPTIESEKNISFRSLNPFTVIRNYFKLKKYLGELNPSLIHIHQLNRLAYFASRAANKLNIPLISTAWGSDVLLIPKQNKFFKYLVTQILKNSAIITADSQDMIEAMKALHPQGNYKLLQYGIDPIQALEKEKIVYSNRLHEPLYRIEKIIEYFKEFSAQNPDWKLVIAGTGSQTELLKTLVKNSEITEKISFVGWQKKPENSVWYAKSSIYISIPSSDGTSVSVLEAMSAGCLPILSDIAVSYEWIVNNENGIIEGQNTNPFTSVLLLDDKFAAQKNKLLVQSKASRTACTERFIELYTDVINYDRKRIY